MKKPKILSKKVAYQCPWLKIEEVKLKLPIGKVVKWQRPLSPDFVAIVPIDKQKNIYLVKEWRLAWEKELLQIPAGHAEGKTEKKRLQQARNELREETGFDAKKWEKLITLPVTARIKLKGHLYLATDLFKSPKEREDIEILKLVKMPFKRALKLLLSGKIPTTSSTILGMLLAKERLKL